MGILRAFGLWIFVVMLVMLMPTVFSELSKTIIVFLESAQKAFAAAGILASHAGDIIPPASL